MSKPEFQELIEFLEFKYENEIQVILKFNKFRFSQILFTQLRKIFMKQWNGLDSLIVIKNIILLVR